MSNLEKYLSVFLDKEQQEYGLPGYDCSVYHHGKEIYRKRSGYSDLEKRQKITENTLFYIFSNTKVITCAAALQLYEQGKYLLEDTLGYFFPELNKMKVKTVDGVKEALNPITIRDIFCMTSGIGYLGINDEMKNKIVKEHDGILYPIDIPEYLADIPLDFEPGTEYYYGISHELLAALIEKLSDMRFSEYLKKYIFEPLEMENTGFDIDSLKSKELATLYGYAGNGKDLINYGKDKTIIPPVLKECASGGLITTVDDYMKFQESLCRDERILHRSTINLMRLNHLNENAMKTYPYANLGWGYGLGVRTTVDHAKSGSPVGFGPFGWGGAAGSYGSIDPENEVSIFYVQHVLDTNSLRRESIIKNIIYSFLK